MAPHSGLRFPEEAGWTSHTRNSTPAVAAAYGFSADLTDEQILEWLLALNLERAAEEEKTARQVKRKASHEKHADELL